MFEVELKGCTSEPLLNYLKAVGILRLVAEDTKRGDALARGAWRNGVFWLRSRLDSEALADFFVNQYQPTPIVVPWSGSDFFGVRTDSVYESLPKAPTSTGIIEAFLGTTTDRLGAYRDIIALTLELMSEAGVKQKKDIEAAKGKELKRNMLVALRARLPEEMLQWIDAAALIAQDRIAFNVLLGSGGGSDGNSHYSDNFMQNLWDCLPDFDGQRAKPRASGMIENALYRAPAKGLSERTASLFNSGAVGGPNATSGFEGDSILNAWDFILAIEGTLCFAGAVGRKLNSDRDASAFPFTVSMSAAGYGTAVDKEESQREIWFPIWNRWFTLGELRLVLSEGRSELGVRSAHNGSDFARAVSSFGVDAGITAFSRVGFVRGRVGGENYNTAISLGQFKVQGRQDSGLLLQVDGWLERFRRATGDSPPRFAEASRRIDAAIVDFCRYGGVPRMAAILRALGNAERQLANGEKFRKTDVRTIYPVPLLTPDWISASDDGSTEFRIALALAMIQSKSLGTIRANLEPVDLSGRFPAWTGGGNEVVWNSGPLAVNMAAVLSRRVLKRQVVDSEGVDTESLPLDSKEKADIDVVSAFLWAQVDDRKIEELLWGLILIDSTKPLPLLRRSDPINNQPLPRSWALLKLLYLPRAIKVEHAAESVHISCEPEIVARLMNRDVTGAMRLAVRRLRSSGIISAIPEEELSVDPLINPGRIAAALLIPVWETDKLLQAVSRPTGRKE